MSIRRICPHFLSPAWRVLQQTSESDPISQTTGADIVGAYRNLSDLDPLGELEQRTQLFSIERAYRIAMFDMLCSVTVCFAPSLAARDTHDTKCAAHLTCFLRTFFPTMHRGMCAYKECVATRGKL